MFENLVSRGIPVTYSHSGGYASHETVVALHMITARAAQVTLSK